MGHIAPTLEEWKDLYEAAKLFKNMAPWRWMVDADVFGIEDPESGEIGYCCVMGALGEVLGLVVYIGSEGLSLFQEIQSGKTSSEEDDVHLRQKCLAIIFEDREMLDKQDLNVIKTLGLKFRGRQSWPCFRSHRPGYVPWFLTGSEARYLNLALRYTMLIAEKVLESALNRAESQYVVGMYQTRMEGCLAREVGEAGSIRQEGVTAPLSNELRMARIKGRAEHVGDAWEVDFFLAPLNGR